MKRICRKCNLKMKKEFSKFLNCYHYKCPKCGRSRVNGASLLLSDKKSQRQSNVYYFTHSKRFIVLIAAAVIVFCGVFL